MKKDAIIYLAGGLFLLLIGASWMIITGGAASRTTSIAQQSQTRALIYKDAADLVRAADNRVVWGYDAGGIYIMVPDEDIGSDIRHSDLLDLVTEYGRDHPRDLPLTREINPKDLGGIRIFDLEDTARIRSGEVIDTLCNSMFKNDAVICAAPPDERPAVLQRRTRRLVHNMMFTHLRNADAAVIDVSGANAHFYKSMTYNRTNINGKTEEHITIGTYDLTPMKCKGCESG